MKYLALVIPALLVLSACSTAVQEEESDVLAGQNSMYVKFSEEAYNKAVENDKIIVLFFYANWCPSCSEENDEAVLALNELERDDIILFRVNYKDTDTDDFEKSLAKEHGVTYQHTKIIIKDGERVDKMPDVWDKDRYLEEFSKL